MTAAPTDLRSFFTALPKIELHRHLEGAIRLSTLVEIAHEYKIDVPSYDLEGLRKHVQITPESPPEAAHFLAKFQVLRRFFCAPEVIQRMAREAVEDAAVDNVKYMELRFTPKALAKLMNFSFDEVIRWVGEGVREAQADHDIQVRLIISMNRHESVHDSELAIRAALDCRELGVVAVDLAGQEIGFPAEPFYGLFAEAQQAGLGITVHAGEWSGPRNIRDAIVHMGATRIGHGVRIVEDSAVVQVAREKQTTFEVCPTSNIQSGSVHSLQFHPLRDMNYLGLKTTINTDDPAISNVTLTDELVLSADKLGVTVDEIKRSVINAAQAAFLPEQERVALVAYFTGALTPV